jgi:maltooligosyltrehalose trehalohydrolase
VRTGELARAVCEGRRNEFADFAAFADPQNRERIPDPNAPETFQASCIDPRERLEPGHREWLELHRSLLRLRHSELVPRLEGSQPMGAERISAHAVSARWTLGDGSLLRIDLNLGSEPVLVNPASEHLLFSSCGATAKADPTLLPGCCARVYLNPLADDHPVAEEAGVA